MGASSSISKTRMPVSIIHALDQPTARLTTSVRTLAIGYESPRSQLGLPIIRTVSAACPNRAGVIVVMRIPDPGWRAGVVTFGPQGPDPVARILTFTSEPLGSDLEVVGPIKLVLYAALSNTDTDFIVKLSEQLAPAAA